MAGQERGSRTEGCGWQRRGRGRQGSPLAAVAGIQAEAISSQDESPDHLLAGQRGLLIPRYAMASTSLGSGIGMITNAGLSVRKK